MRYDMRGFQKLQYVWHIQDFTFLKMQKILKLGRNSSGCTNILILYFCKKQLCKENKIILKFCIQSPLEWKYICVMR